MGLDQSIYKKKKTEPTFVGREEVAYWRKFNALHKWFVDNVQRGVDDCEYHLITKEKLNEISVLMGVLSIDRDFSKLPPQSGFFFGSTEINEWYWERVKESVIILEKLLKETDFENYELYYRSSW